MPKKGLFLAVDLEVLQSHGVEIAVLLEFIRFTGKFRKKDGSGFFSLETEHICASLKWSKHKVIRKRDELIRLGLIEFRAGKNQNLKNQYRV